MRDFRQVKLKYVADIYTGNSIPDNEKSRYVNGAIPYIPTMEIEADTGKINYDNGLSVNADDGFKIAPADSVLMCVEGGSAGKKIGVTEKQVAFVNKLCCLAPVGVFHRLLHYCLLSNDFQEQFRLNMTGIIGGVSVSALKNLSITLPPSEEEQRAISAYLDAQTARIDEALFLNRAQIEELRLYKQSLITETVTRGLDPDAPMKDSGVDWIGAMPESWSVQRVRDIGWTQNGISKKGDFFGSGFPFVSYGDVYRNYELPFSVSGQIESDAKERESYSVQAGDIFFTRTSETIDEVGFSCVCKKTIPEAVFAGFLIRLRPYKAESVILSDYAKYYFRSGHIRQYLTKEMNLVTRASLAQGLLKAMNVLIPPKKEQEAIAAFLDNKTAKIDALISLKQSKIEKLTRYRQSLIYEYVTGKKEAP